MNYKVKRLYKVKVYDTMHTIAAENIEELIKFTKSYFATKGEEPSIITLDEDYIIVIDDNGGNTTEE